MFSIVVVSKANLRKVTLKNLFM